MSLIEELRDPLKAMSKESCKRMMGLAAAEIEHLERRLETAREGLKDIAGRAHSRLANSEDMRGL